MFCGVVYTSLFHCQLCEFFHMVLEGIMLEA